MAYLSTIAADAMDILIKLQQQEEKQVLQSRDDTDNESNDDENVGVNVKCGYFDDSEDEIEAVLETTTVTIPTKPTTVGHRRKSPSPLPLGPSAPSQPSLESSSSTTTPPPSSEDVIEEEEESGRPEEEEDDDDDEPVSPHIDTTWIQNNDKENNAPVSTSVLSPSLLPTLSNFMDDDEDNNNNNHHHHHHHNINISSPTSTTSTSHQTLFSDLSDLEQTLHSDTTTIKSYLRTLKKERDTLRTKNCTLNQQLTDTTQSYTDDIYKLKVDNDMILKKKEDEYNDMLVEELSKARVRMEDELRDQSDVANTELATLRTELESSNTEVSRLEESLLKEKSGSTLREANKVEEAHKAHFVELSNTITELEGKFEVDMRKCASTKDQVLHEEREHHTQTREELNVERKEKERIMTELYDMEQELGRLVLEHEGCTTAQHEVGVSHAKELEVVHTELHALRTNHTTVKKELQSVSSSKEELVIELRTKSDQLTNTLRQLKEAQTSHVHEMDSMKTQLKNMCELNEVTSADRNVAQRELREAQSVISTVTKSNDDGQIEITRLQDEAKKRTNEIHTLHESRKLFEQYEMESKMEIDRLKEKLEMSTADILRSVQSSNSDDSEEKEGAAKEGDEDMVVDDAEKEDENIEHVGTIDDEKEGLPDSSTSTTATTATTSKALALPKLVDEASIAATEISIVEEVSSSTTSSTLMVHRDQLVAMTKERDALRLEMDTHVRERDVLVDDAANHNQDDVTTIDDELSTLKMNLVKAEEAYVSLEVEKCNMLGSITSERDALVHEVKTLKASLLLIQNNNNTSAAAKSSPPSTTAIDDTTIASPQDIIKYATSGEVINSTISADINDSVTIKAGENVVEVKVLQDKLDTQMKVNDRLSRELTLLKETLSHDNNDEEAKEKATDKTLEEGDVCHQEEVAEKVKEDDSEPQEAVEEDAQQHEDDAVVTQLQEQLDIKIDENKQLSSELEQLQEHLDTKKKEYQVLSSEFTALKATATNDDYAAAIEISKEIEDMKYEHRVEIKLLKKEHAATNAATKTEVKLLTKEKDELSSAYEAERTSNNDLEASLEEMVNLLQAERDIHSEKADEYKAMKKEYTPAGQDDTEISNLRETNKSLEDKSKHLTNELVDSTKAFQETIESYESVIAKVKHALLEKKQVNEKLKNDLNEAKQALTHLETSSKADATTQEDEINAYREAVDVLKKKLEAQATNIRLLEEDKTKLRLESGRLKSEFTEVISNFEKELAASCDANEEALCKKHVECEAVHATLATSKAELMRLRSDLANAEGHDRESSQIISKLRDALSKRDSDVKSLETKLEGAMINLDNNIESYEQQEKSTHKLHGELRDMESKKEEIEQLLAVEEEESRTYQTEVEELQSKLKGTMQSLEENVEFYEQLRSECTDLKEEKEALFEENTELTAKVSTLAQAHDEHTAAIEKLDEYAAKIAVLTGENGTLKAQIERQHSSVDFIENQLDSIREEVRKAEEARQVSSDEAAEAKGLLQEATSKLRDLNALCTKHENEIDSLRHAVKKAEKERHEASDAAKSSQVELQKATNELNEMLKYTKKLKVDHDDATSKLLNEQLTSMNEVVQSLQSQVKSTESAKEENRRMYERDINLQQAEVETLRTKHNDAQSKLNTLSDLVTSLKAALESEKENAQILLSQFKKSEGDRKSHVKQKEELEAELARLLMSDQTKTEKIRNLESKEKKLDKAEVELKELRAKEQELNSLHVQMIEKENDHNNKISELKSKVNEDTRKYMAVQEKIASMEAHASDLQQEFKRTLHKKEEEASKSRVELSRLYEENEELRHGNNDSLQSLKQMLNDAIRSRANTDASLQESLQLLEQQKRIDIKRKSEIAKLEQTVEILKSKERYLESYVASLKKQMRRA